LNHPEVERTHSAAGPCVLVPHILKDSGVIAGFSCRGGGVSGDPYQSLNVGLHVGDRPDAVIENRRRLCVALGVRLAQWVGLEQVHGNRVAVVGRKHRGKGSVSLRNALPGVDAAITNVSGLVLAVLAADCVPLLFYDPVARAVGVAHAGWKGTLSGISRRVVEGMAREYGSCPEHIRVASGPQSGPAATKLTNGFSNLIRWRFAAVPKNCCGRMGMAGGAWICGRRTGSSCWMPDAILGMCA
jgi:YfiH family protein